MRWKSIELADQYLIEFEANFIKRKGEVRWARHAGDVVQELQQLTVNLPGASVRLEPGPWLDELALRAALAQSKIPITENPSSGRPLVAVGHAAYAVADPGALLIPPAQQKAMLSWPADILQFWLVPVDRIIPALRDISLLASGAMTDGCTPFGSLVFAPSGQRRFVVCFFDNGRSGIMAEATVREAMRCIRCGGCERYDTVATLAAHASFKTREAGDLLPYRSMTAPYQGDFASHIGESFVHPLDQRMRNHCPVQIDFRKLCLHNRKAAADRNLGGRSRMFYFLWKKSVTGHGISPPGIKTMRYFVYTLFNKSPRGLREETRPAKKSFNRMWREKMHLN